MTLDKDNFPVEKFQKLRKYMEIEGFNYETFRAVSEGCGNFYEW